MLLARVLPWAAVSARTVERVTGPSARARQAAEDAVARECRERPAELDERAPEAEAQRGDLWGFRHPERIQVGLDGVLVRGRKA